MKAERRFIGEGRAPLVIVDDFSGDLPAIIALAAALAPFPAPVGTAYPGVRRVIEDEDGAAAAYVRRSMDVLAPFVAGGFDIDRFVLIEASFSMVTQPPTALQPAQRAPHYDATDPNLLAVLHYLTPTAGTAFYRQRATGIEQVSEANAAAFATAAGAARLRATGYIGASDPDYEQIASVEGVADRIVVYPGRLLHSGLIPPDMMFSPDPRVGRLTANFFLKAYRG